jgi:hypothetical protein
VRGSISDFTDGPFFWERLLYVLCSFRKSSGKKALPGGPPYLNSIAREILCAMKGASGFILSRRLDAGCAQASRGITEVSMQTQFIAHVRKKDRKPQYLWEHLEEVSELAEQFAGKVGLKDENGDSKLTRH